MFVERKAKPDERIIKKRYIFASFDRLLGDFTEFTVADSAGQAARSLLLTLRVPVKDCDLYCLGEYRCDIPTEVTVVPINCLSFKYYSTPKIYPWSVYHFPESVSEAMAPLGASADEIREREEYVAKYNAKKENV